MAVEKLQLTLHATGLKNVAGLGKGTSDPFAIVTLLASGPGDKPRVLGKTEVIKNSLSPKWTTSFLFDYNFGKETHINVSVVDEVRKQSDKPMGSAVFEIGDILGSRGSTKAKKTKKGWDTLRSYHQSSNQIGRKLGPSVAWDQTQKCRWIVWKVGSLL